MNVFLDNIIFSLQKTGGISCLWSSVLNKLLLDSEFKISLLHYKNSNIHFDDKKIRKEIVKNTFSYPIFIERFLNPSINTYNGVFHSSYYRYLKSEKVYNITTVHDFINEKFRKEPLKHFHSYQKFNAIKNSDKIICVSKNTKKDLLKFFPNIDHSKVSVVYNGVSQNFFQLKDCNNLKSIIPFEKNEYLLYVGSRSFYKNFHMTIQTAKKLKKPLVIVGPNFSTQEKKILKKILKNRFFILENIPQKILNILYNNALCLLYPSSYEGFGMPIIEAQKAGCPVILNNKSSIPELVHKSAILLNNINSSKIIEAVKFLDNDSYSRNEYICKGLKNAKRFSIECHYKLMKKIYNQSL